MMIQWFNYKEGDGERRERAGTDLNSLVFKNNLNDSIKTANYTNFTIANFETFYSIFFLNVSTKLSRNK